MTKAEKLTLERLDQKVDDLIMRFDRFISTLKWSIGLLITLTGVGATVVLVVTK